MSILQIMTPFVKDQLVKNIVASLFYTVNFDESMNRVLQNEKIDIQIHFWASKPQWHQLVTLIHCFF